MKPFQCKGVSGRKVGHKCKCKPKCSQITVKEEITIKEEPNDMIQYSPPPSPIGTGATIKSESESDDDCMQNDVKDEIKCEDECAKTECDTAKDDGGEGGIDENGPVDANADNPNRDDIPHTSNGKKPKDAKKVRKNKISKKSKVAPKLKKHKCQVCNYLASNKSILKIHMRVHNGERPFAREICAKAFNQKSSLNRHKKIHDPNLTFRCLKCRIDFTEEIGKINHETKCKRPQYQCHLCKSTTRNLSHLKQHMRIHNGVRPFKCRVCFKTFTRKYHLNVHLRIHVEQLPFDCQKCGQRFGNKNQKILHEDRCTGRRYDCYLCKYKCFQKCDLKKHMRSNHTGEKPFSCGICQKAYRQKNDLKRHLTTHKRKQPIRCSKCWKKFAEEDGKNAHEDRCKRRTHQCYLCKIVKQDSTQMKGHMRTHHTGEKPFPCELCGLRFVWQNIAKRHMKKVHQLKK
ncbi:zinc finger protein 583-like [Contarinia nasturtii]|uniref:zinc finger protein 583-like n=1 Tax=Contarinia nasturtii TaxID=265458 RepID=UPI0012D41542|nr:zinc finger protein 583-like [Contarinia nasturtii]